MSRTCFNGKNNKNDDCRKIFVENSVIRLRRKNEITYTEFSSAHALSDGWCFVTVTLPIVDIACSVVLIVADEASYAIAAEASSRNDSVNVPPAALQFSCCCSSTPSV